MKKISKNLARSIGDVIGIDWNKIDLNQFHKGIQVELEHGSKLGEKTNITKNDLIVTGKIALAHLLELSDYYTKLEKMEQNNRIKEMVQKIVKEQVSYLLNEERNMYGEIIDPVYYIEIWPRKGLQYDVGPFETEWEAEQEILIQVGSREHSIRDEARLIPQGNQTWYYEEYEVDYSIVERDKQ